MDREVELSFDLSGQRAGMNLRIPRLSLLNKAHNLCGELVCTLRATPARQQSCESLALKGHFSLIVRWAGHAEERGGLGLGGALVLHMTQHLVFDLHEVLRIEEDAGLEPSGPHSLGMAVEYPQSLQTFCFGIASTHGAKYAARM